MRTNKLDALDVFGEMLLVSGREGVSRWTMIGKLKLTNPGSLPSLLRKKHGVGISKGSVYRLEDLKDVYALIKLLAARRRERLLPPLDEMFVLDCISAYENKNQEKDNQQNLTSVQEY